VLIWRQVQNLALTRGQLRHQNDIIFPLQAVIDIFMLRVIAYLRTNHVLSLSRSSEHCAGLQYALLAKLATNHHFTLETCATRIKRGTRVSGGLLGESRYRSNHRVATFLQARPSRRDLYAWPFCSWLRWTSRVFSRGAEVVVARVAQVALMIVRAIDARIRCTQSALPTAT
jgi:hypothetical protein